MSEFGDSTGGLVGQTLGQYRIEGRIGSGGMATVYLAEQPSIGRKVAVKVLPAIFMNDPTFLERFKREVQVIARLQHPRIVPVYDYGEHDSLPYIVMAYLDGGTLRDHIRDDGPLELTAIIRLTRQIAEGLDHAHKQGIIHRDFKPGNVLLDKSGNAYLADFGIAKISESASQLTGSGLVGTPAYMAPEMIDRAEASPSVDIYALGATVYEMLTGNQPFYGETPLRVMMAHAQDQIPDVRAAMPDLPPAMTHVINRALAKRPEMRYQTSFELVEALEDAAKGKPIEPLPEEEQGAGTVVLEKKAPAVPAAPAVVPPAPGTAVDDYVSPSATDMGVSTGAVPEPASSKKKRGCSPVTIIGIGVGVLLLGGACVLGSMFVLPALNGNDTTAPPPIATGITENIDPTAVPPTAVPPTPAPAVDNEPGFRIINQTDQPFCEVYAVLSDASDFDEGFIRGGDPVAVGEERFFAVSPGDYILIAEPCNTSALRQYRGNIPIGNGAFQWTVTGTYSATLTVINDSSTDLCYLYISPPTEEVWGPDQLELDEIVLVGGSFTFTLPPGTWDVLGETCDEEYWEEYGFNIETNYEWTLTD